MAIVPNDKDSDYSPTWKLVDSEPVGWAELEDPSTWPKHVELRKAMTENGTKLVWELELAGGKGNTSLWLDPAVLVTKVRAELQRRKSTRGVAQLEPGERVYLDPGTKRASKRTAGQTVWPFPEVRFENGVPEPSAEELLLSGAPAEDESDVDDALDDAAAEAPIPEQSADNEEGARGDDIPF